MYAASPSSQWQWSFTLPLLPQMVLYAMLFLISFDKGLEPLVGCFEFGVSFFVISRAFSCSIFPAMGMQCADASRNQSRACWLTCSFLVAWSLRLRSAGACSDYHWYMYPAMSFDALNLLWYCEALIIIIFSYCISCQTKMTCRTVRAPVQNISISFPRIIHHGR